MEFYLLNIKRIIGRRFDDQFVQLNMKNNAISRDALLGIQVHNLSENWKLCLLAG